MSEKTLLLEYNLQFFAEEGPGGEKTEKPTPKKKKDAREEGQVAKSIEITTSFLLVAMFSTIKIFGGNILDQLIKFTQDMYALFSLKEISVQYASGLTSHIIITLINLVLPFFLVAVLVSLISNFIQVGWHPTAKPLKPKLSNINPINGIKRLFSFKAVVELLKSILKIGIILAIVYSTIKNYDEVILVIYSIPVIESYKMIADICLDIGIKVGAFFLIIAAIDYSYQRYELYKKLKMTKQEIKEEYKQSEGNPEIKSKIKQRMREASMRRMMQDLPNADVVITNPTHFAVAIQYDGDKNLAPLVVAKGADLVAARIRETAKDHDIQIVENKPLARTLFYTVEIGDEIPEELYQVAAEILAFVYNSKHKP